jgi:cystathionine beta-lyase
VRLGRHQETALTLARWLQQRPEVERVLHPALPDDPGHALWRRDFTGASGLFAMILKPCSRSAMAAFLDHMELFGMGYSWGGYESLILPAHPENIRTATRWSAPGPLIRLHAGLEDVNDLIADLDRGFQRLAAAA